MGNALAQAELSSGRRSTGDLRWSRSRKEVLKPLFFRRIASQRP